MVLIGSEMRRREFIKKAGIAVFGGKILYDSIIDLKDFLNKDKIYNDLPNYVKTLVNIRTYNAVGNNPIQFDTGTVFRVNDDLFTCYHNVQDRDYTISHPRFGNLPVKAYKQKSKKLTIDGLETKVVNYNEETDSAICEMTDELDKVIKPLPCDYGNVEMGDEVYMIGNPHTLGIFVKKGHVGKLTPQKGMARKLTLGCFLMDASGIPGDSGSPVINKNFELVGVTHAGGDSVRAAITYIKNYTDLLKKSNQLNNRRFKNE